jgi:hypothetical protein
MNSNANKSGVDDLRIDWSLSYLINVYLNLIVIRMVFFCGKIYWPWIGDVDETFDIFKPN